mmetsp:Transcript_24387/g.58855  ORF Transcript_24387/g.58855 Transcript_24387/m.58855 type:complete len:338 (+) Transcript_24387:2258-3271(+)
MLTSSPSLSPLLMLELSPPSMLTLIDSPLLSNACNTIVATTTAHATKTRSVQQHKHFHLCLRRKVFLRGRTSFEGEAFLPLGEIFSRSSLLLDSLLLDNCRVPASGCRLLRLLARCESNSDVASPGSVLCSKAMLLLLLLSPSLSSPDSPVLLRGSDTSLCSWWLLLLFFVSLGRWLLPPPLPLFLPNASPSDRCLSASKGLLLLSTISSSSASISTRAFMSPSLFILFTFLTSRLLLRILMLMVRATSLLDLRLRDFSAPFCGDGRSSSPAAVASFMSKVLRKLRRKLRRIFSVCLRCLLLLLLLPERSPLSSSRPLSFVSFLAVLLGNKASGSDF